MTGSRYRGFGLSVSLLVALAGSAHATINMTGRWVAEGGAVLYFTQDGTLLTESPGTVTLPDGTNLPRIGTIDSASGAFGVRDELPCDGLARLPSCEIDGTVAADGLTFNGELLLRGGARMYRLRPTRNLHGLALALHLRQRHRRSGRAV